MRSLEIFATSQFGVETDETGDAAIGVENHRNLAIGKKSSPDRAGGPTILGDIAAIDQLHRRGGDPSFANPQRLQNERQSAAVGGAAHQAETVISCVAGQQFDLSGGQAVNRVLIRRYRLDGDSGATE